MSSQLVPKNPVDDTAKVMGRPRKEIDWELLEEYARAGMSAVEIAPYFNTTDDTICNRIKDKYGVTFSTFSAYFRSNGDANIRLVQYQKALGTSKKGDNTMLLHLGKHRLGQKDESIVHVTQEIVDQYEAISKQVAQAQAESLALKSAVIIIKDDSKS